MANPRNQTAKSEPAQTNSGVPSPDQWSFMGLGSASLKNGRDLVRDNDFSFVINPRNAEIFRDAAQFVLDNPEDDQGKEQRITLNAAPLYEDKVSEKVLKYFTHRVFISKETVAKWGKSFADYVKKPA